MPCYRFSLTVHHCLHDAIHIELDIAIRHTRLVQPDFFIKATLLLRQRRHELEDFMPGSTQILEFKFFATSRVHAKQLVAILQHNLILSPLQPTPHVSDTV